MYAARSRTCRSWGGTGQRCGLTYLQRREGGGGGCAGGGGSVSCRRESGYVPDCLQFCRPFQISHSPTTLYPHIHPVPARSAACAGPPTIESWPAAATTTSYLCGTSSAPSRCCASASTKRQSRPSPGRRTSTACWCRGAAPLTAASASGTRPRGSRCSALIPAVRCVGALVAP